MTREPIPLFNLGPENATIAPTLERELRNLIASGQYVNGVAVERFEADFAGIHGRDYRCVGVASGLDALRLALIAVGATHVVAPVLTFAATWEAVEQAGATIVPVDVCDDGLIDVGQANAQVDTCDTVIAVHLHGAVANVASLAPSFCVIEDAAQAHGADGVGKHSVSDAACYSFYPTKPLGALGDAGAVVTKSEAIASTVRSLRVHGLRNGAHEHVGYTSRLDAFQAVVLRHKLPQLSRMNWLRRQLAAQYYEALDGVGDVRLPEIDDSHPVHVYAIRTARRDDLAAFLHDRHIQTGRHYARPLHLEPAYWRVGIPKGMFPVAERIARETLSLPCYPSLGAAGVVRVADTIKEFYN